MILDVCTPCSRLVCPRVTVPQEEELVEVEEMVSTEDIIMICPVERRRDAPNGWTAPIMPRGNGLRPIMMIPTYDERPRGSWVPRA
jgi:hypothetical protein